MLVAEAYWFNLLSLDWEDLLLINVSVLNLVFDVVGLENKVLLSLLTPLIDNIEWDSSLKMNIFSDKLLIKTLLGFFLRV